MTLVKRLVKGSALTASEHDGNMDHVLEMDNMAEGTDTKILTAAERSAIAALGTAATAATEDFATAAQGALADSATQPGDSWATLDGTAWRVAYTDGSGNVTELALGEDGTFLKSNGASSAPTFATPAGSGDVSKVGTPADNQVGVWTGDGTIEGTSGLTYDGTAFGVTGNITVSGTVDGRDVAADGALAAGALQADGGVAVLIDSDPAAITHSSGGSAINLASVVTNSVRVTLTANSDGLTPPTADPASGNEREILVTLVQDGSGSHTVANLTADADVSLADGTIAPAVDTTAGAETSFVLKGNSAGAWLLYGDPTIRTAQIEDDAVTRAKIADAAMSGADATLITGTAGTNGNLLQWNGDGDAVDSSIAAASVLVDADIGSAVQAWDAQLDTWAGVTPSANGQSLVAAADYAAMKGLLDLEIGTDVESFTSLSANQYSARNTGNSAKEARTDKRVMSVAFDVTDNGTYPIAMIGHFGMTLSEVSGSCEGGSCDYQITKGGSPINGFGSAISLTTSVTDTASTETLAEDAKLRVVITNASSLTGLYITFKGVRTGE